MLVYVSTCGKGLGEKYGLHFISVFGHQFHFRFLCSLDLLVFVRSPLAIIIPRFASTLAFLQAEHWLALAFLFLRFCSPPAQLLMSKQRSMS